MVSPAASMASIRTIPTACFFLTTIVAAAESAMTLGQVPPSGGMPAGCPSDYEAVQSSVGLGTAYDIPGPGVVTVWMTNGHNPVVTEGGGTFTDNGDSAALRVYRRVSGSNTLTPVAESSTQTLASGGPVAFTTRIPVNGGELIGLRIAAGGGDGSSVCLQSFGPDLNKVLTAAPAGPLNAERAMSVGNQFRVDVGVILEPDADRDGFGDETQDQCPTDADTQGDCPIPDTTITTAPKSKTRKRKATIAFSSDLAGATFECALDDGPFAPCSSPAIVKVKRGKHTFAVRATAKGQTDASPSGASWKVKK